jgi:hypothetical protein
VRVRNLQNNQPPSDISFSVISLSFIDKENLTPDMPSNIIQIYSSKAHGLELIFPPKKERPRRFKNIASMARWYIHPRFWKQAFSAITIYAALFAIWVYWCKS